MNNKYVHNWKKYNGVLNAKALNENEAPKEDRHSVSAQAQRRLARARLLIVTKQPFFGNLLSYLLTEERTDLKYKTMATDGIHLYYDPGFVMKHTDEEIMWVVVHEVMHCALKHFIRRQANPEIWNAAADYALNQLISDLPATCGVMLPESLGGSKDETKTKNGILIKEKVVGWSAEQIYHFLLENGVDLPPEEKWNFGGIEPPDPNDKPEDQPDNSGDSDPNEIKVTPQDLKNPEAMDKYWEERLKESITKNQGSMPENFKRKLMKLLQPKVDWKSKLKRFIISLGEKHRYDIPDRRFIGMDDIQWTRTKIKSAFDEMIVIADTSGSIGTKELTAMVSECVKIMEEFKPKEILLMWCDSILHLPVEKVTKQSMNKFDSPRGGGGTDFRPPFEWIKKNLLGKKSLGPIVYFTDGFGNFPAASEFGLSQYKDNVIWVIIGTEGYSSGDRVAVPFGQRIDLPL